MIRIVGRVEPGSLGVRFIGRRHFAHHRVLFLVIRIRCLCYLLFGKLFRPGTSKKPIDQHKLDLKTKDVYRHNSPIRSFPPGFLISNNIDNLPMKLVVPLFQRIGVDHDI